MTSSLEREFESLWQACGDSELEPVREHTFHPVRRWRFDFAFPAQRVAIELEGGVHSRGRHTRGKGFIADCDKYNAAAELGWTVLRYTSEHLKRSPVQVVEQVLRVIEGR